MEVLRQRKLNVDAAITVDGGNSIFFFFLIFVIHSRVNHCGLLATWKSKSYELLSKLNCLRSQF